MQDETEGGIGQVIFKAAATLLVIFGLIGFGFYSAVSQNGIYVVVKYFWNTAKLAINELPNHLEVGPPPGFVREGRKPGEGVTINTLPDDGSRVLLSSFFGAGPGLSLIDRSGATLATWPALFSQHFPDPSKFDGHIPWTDLNIDIHGSYIEPDGSVLFNFEYGGTVKLDRCGKPLWTIAEATHHSIDKAEDGGYWIPSRNYFPAGSTAPDEVFPPFTDVPVPTDFADDLILKVSADGEVVIRKSVMRILYDNGFEPLLTSTGINFYPDVMGRFELLHLNKITELKSSMAEAFPMFQAGDLLLSIRDNNMLVVVDPDDWKVKWHQIGPWIRQHDPEFMPDGTISLFNNNAYLTSLGPGEAFRPDVPFASEVMNVNPATGQTRVVYGNRPGQEMLTVIRGKIDPLPLGGYMVAEFEGGRAFQIDASGQIVWEYINRYDERLIYEVTEALPHPASYFTVTDWSCP